MSVIVEVCVGLGVVLFEQAIAMIVPANRRTGILLFILAVILLTTPISGSLAAAFVRHGSAGLEYGTFRHVGVPSPLIFFPIVGMAAVGVGLFSEFRKNRSLADRLAATADKIDDFRLEGAANRPVFSLRNLQSAVAAMQYQNREKAAYQAKFKKELIKLAEDMSAVGLGTLKDLLNSFLGPKDLASVEKDLLSFVEQIDQIKNAIRLRAFWKAFLLGVPPAIIWLIWALASHANA
jgi:hypothetical protein